MGTLGRRGGYESYLLKLGGGVTRQQSSDRAGTLTVTALW